MACILKESQRATRSTPDFQVEVSRSGIGLNKNFAGFFFTLSTNLLDQNETASIPRFPYH